MGEAYHEVRYRWLHPTDLNKLEERMKSYGFATQWHKYSSPEHSLFPKRHEELEVKADTLIAHLTEYRAIITHRDQATLTEKDNRLEKLMRDEYSHGRSFL